MRIIPSVAVVSLSLVCLLAAQDRAYATGPAAVAPAPLFAADTVIEVTLSGPLDAVTDERTDDAEYRDAVFSYRDPATGDEVVLDVGLKTRGNFRRRATNCAFPPLRVNFRRKQVSGTLFDGQDKIKLVTHCLGSMHARHHVVNEYLAYRTLNVLSDRSLRVRLLDVRYVSSDKKNREIRRHAFLLEPEDQLAARHGAEVRENARIGHADLDPEYSNLVEMFQYMISNLDWSMIRGAESDDCCHNFILLTTDDELYYSVPYDFDFSGVVDAPYAAHPEHARSRDVRRRFYGGRCRPADLLERTIAHFNASRPAIYALYEGNEALGDKHARRTLRYYDAFYNTINNKKKRDKHIERRCTGAAGS